MCSTTSPSRSVLLNTPHALVFYIRAVAYSPRTWIGGLNDTYQLLDLVLYAPFCSPELGGPHGERRVKLPATAHTSRPWRIHELTPDFQLEDVWALPTPEARETCLGSSPSSPPTTSSPRRPTRRSCALGGPLEDRRRA